MANKYKTCKNCKTRYEKERGDAPFKNWCSESCRGALALARFDKDQKNKKAKIARHEKEKDQAWNAETRRRRKAARTLPQWKREYTRYFNRFIVLRDHDKPCSTCGAYVLEPPGIFHCGHYKPVSTHPHLAYVETNAHKQCSFCNTGSEVSPTKNITVSRAYDIEIINRVGAEEAARLNSPLPLLQLRIPDIEPQVEIYKKKCKEMKNALEAQS